jgi:hypothetical protein
MARSRETAAAAKKAFAAAVKPLTGRPGAPRPSRPAAVFKRARSVSDVEVEVVIAAGPAGAGTFDYRTPQTA